MVLIEKPIPRTMLVLGISLSLNGCGSFVPEGERLAVALHHELSVNSTHEFDMRHWTEAIRKTEPTARLDLLGLLLEEPRVDIGSAIFDRLHEIAVKENDLILLGDLEFCKNDSADLAIFSQSLAKLRKTEISNTREFYQKIHSEVNQAREKALSYYLAAGDYYGASFVESEISYHAETAALQCSHIQRALDYLEKGRKNPKRKMYGSLLVYRLFRGTFEGELRTRLKELSGK